MNVEIKAEWLKRLRSGQYQQAISALNRLTDEDDLHTAGYCCLGVLCEIAVEQGIIKKKTEEDGRKLNAAFFGDELDWSNGYLPESVVRWAELSDTDPGIGDPTSPYNTLAEANDSGEDFNAIADIIEERF